MIPPGGISLSGGGSGGGGSVIHNNNNNNSSSTGEIDSGSSSAVDETEGKPKERKKSVAKEQPVRNSNTTPIYIVYIRVHIHLDSLIPCSISNIYLVLLLFNSIQLNRKSENVVEPYTITIKPQKAN